MENILEKVPVKRVQEFINQFDSKLKVLVLDTTARTAKDAAESLGSEVGAIVKSLVFRTDDTFLICLVAGDKRCSLNKLKKILLRLYHSYVKKYLDKIIISLLLSLLVAGSTAAIAWLLDPAIEKMFIEQDKSMMLIIPAAIVLAFTCKGLSLYMARVVLIKVGSKIVLVIQKQLASTILN